jgi:hypothetical protein
LATGRIRSSFAAMLSAPMTLSAPDSLISYSLMVLPVSGAPTENDRSIDSRNWLLSGSSSTSPFTAKLPAGTGGSAMGSVQ